MKILSFNVSDYSDKEIENFKKYVDTKKGIISSQTAIAHYQTKLFLSKIHNEPIDDIKFQIKDNGKPFYAKGPHFSITHTGDLVYIVFDQNNIGVDAERIRTINPKMLSRVASSKEVIDFNNNFDIEFLKLWTIKEAYFKYTGTGITDLRSITAKEISERLDTTTLVTDKYVITIVKGR